MDKYSLEPYKALGICIDNKKPNIFNAGDKLFLACSTKGSFKIYGLPDLKIKVHGVLGKSNIKAILGVNNNCYVAYNNEVVVFENHHVVKRFKLYSKSRISSILQVGLNLLVGADNGALINFDIESEEKVWEMFFNEEIIQIVHPNTYLNKVIVLTKHSLELINVLTMKSVYKYDKTLGKLLFERNGKIITCVVSPVLDVAALSITGGILLIFNLKSDEILFELKLQSDISSISFSKANVPLMILGSVCGTIQIFHLNEKKCISTITNQFTGNVNLLEFIGDSLNFVAGSGKNNCIKTFKYDESETNLFYLLREKSGPKNPINKLEFYNEKHLIISTTNDNAEIWDISLLNEAMNMKFSLKQKDNLNSVESLFRLNTVSDFSSSTNRERDWGNLICSHVKNSKATIWSTENKSVIKKTLKVPFECEENITKVYMTNCGNFALLGFESGIITKLNVQSGDHKLSFNENLEVHKNPIVGLFSDALNKYLVSCDSSSLCLWDFFSGKLIKNDQSLGKNVNIQILKSQKLSNFFLLGDTENFVCLYTIENLQKSRIFKISQGVTDCIIFPDNKFIAVSTIENNLFIYNVLSGHCVSNLKFDKMIVSLDICSDLSCFALVFDGERQISILRNCIQFTNWNPNEVHVSFFSHLKKMPKNRRDQKIKNDNSKQGNQNLISDLDIKKLTAVSLPQDNSLITYTNIPMGKFISLVHWDLIKTKNRPQLKDDHEFEIPFFLDFDNIKKIKEEVESQKKNYLASKSKILRNQTDKYLSELGCELEILLENNEIECEEILEALKKKNPAQIDYEMRKVFFGNPKAILSFLNFFEKLIVSKKEFDIVQVILANFFSVS